MATIMATDVGAAELVKALERHFGGQAGEWDQLTRDVAIWICRHWTNEPARTIGELFGVNHGTVVRADERISAAKRDQHAIRNRVRDAENFLAAEAFPLEDEEDDDAIERWSRR